MKKIFLFLSFAVLSFCVRAQNNDHTVSFDGIGKLQLAMTKPALEKLLSMKIVFKHIGIEEVYEETVPAKYMGTDVELTFFKSEDRGAVLEGIKTTNPLCKMIEGIGIGTDQSTIVDKFENHLLIIQPDYMDSEGPDFKLSKTNSTITLANIDNLHSGIIFHMVNKKVVAIEVAPTAEFRDRE